MKVSNFLNIDYGHLARSNMSSHHYKNISAASEDCRIQLKNYKFNSYKLLKNQETLNAIEIAVERINDEPARQRMFEGIIKINLAKFIFLNDLKVNEIIVNEFIRQFTGVE